MPQTRECDFCGDDIEPGTGTMYVEINGTVTHFCSSKCESNAGLGREARDVEWTAAGSEARGTTTPTAEPEEPAADEEAEVDEESDEEETEADEEIEADEPEPEEPTDDEEPVAGEASEPESDEEPTDTEADAADDTEGEETEE